jgi:predicted metal-dependent hydrolase
VKIKNRRWGCAVEEKVIELKSVGTILLERSNRARHLSVSIRPFKGVRVAVPFGVSFDRAQRFAQSKAVWIKKHSVRMKLLEQRTRKLSNSPPIKRSEARSFLIGRLEKLAKKHGFTYNRVFIRNQKTRWGSCSIKNNINLNINLVRLPDALIDYTILHELVHTRIKNHGERFWDQLDRVLGDAKKLDKRLSQYNLLLA